MALNIKLSERRKVPDDPVEGRPWIGFDPNESEEILFEMNRGVWRLSQVRAAREPFATFSFAGTIRFAARIDRLEPFDTPDPGHQRKSWIVGRVLPHTDPAWRPLRAIAVDTHRNPVTYLPDPPGVR